MTVVYCPMKRCQYNEAMQAEDEGICSKDEIEMGKAEYTKDFAYCPEYDEYIGERC